MSIRHTPEPWSIDKDYAKAVRSEKGIIICNTSQNNAPHLQYNDAKRIVECVNAMKGIDNPVEFMEVVKQLELDAYQKLKAQHDELDALMKDMHQVLKEGRIIPPNSLIAKAIEAYVNK